MANFDDLFTAPTATETQSDRPQLTKEEYAAKKKAERDSLYALADEMAQEVMRDGEAFRGFLDLHKAACCVLTHLRPPPIPDRRTTRKRKVGMPQRYIVHSYILPWKQKKGDFHRGKLCDYAH